MFFYHGAQPQSWPFTQGQYISSLFSSLLLSTGTFHKQSRFLCFRVSGLYLAQKADVNILKHGLSYVLCWLFGWGGVRGGGSGWEEAWQAIMYVCVMMSVQLDTGSSVAHTKIIKHFSLCQTVMMNSFIRCLTFQLNRSCWCWCLRISLGALERQISKRYRGLSPPVSRDGVFVWEYHWAH